LEILTSELGKNLIIFPGELVIILMRLRPYIRRDLRNPISKVLSETGLIFDSRCGPERFLLWQCLPQAVPLSVRVCEKAGL
jgi:hypothetical protein